MTLPFTASHGRTVAASLAAITAGQLPVFLTGALAVQIRDDLVFSADRLGLAIGMFFIASAVSSWLLGHIVERVGWRLGMGVAITISTICLVGIAGFAQSWSHLVFFLALGGVANAIGQPAVNLLLARLIPSTRHGLVFAIKQSALPLATLLGGLGVPLVALTVGWRWAYAIAAGIAVVAAVLIPRRTDDQPQWRAAVRSLAPPWRRTGAAKRTQGDTISVPPLLVLAAAGVMGAIVGNVLGGFLVSSAVSGGFGPAAAGVLLAVGSGAGIATRVLLGWLADRFTFAPTTAMMILLTVGAGGCLLLTGQGTAQVIGGTMLGFCAGWAWPGLFNLAVIRSHPSAPALATSITQTGIYAGAAGGPIVFGLVVEHGGYPQAWTLAAVIAVLGGVLAFIGGRRLPPQLSTGAG